MASLSILGLIYFIPVFFFYNYITKYKEGKLIEKFGREYEEYSPLDKNSIHINRFISRSILAWIETLPTRRSSPTSIRKTQIHAI